MAADISDAQAHHIALRIRELTENLLQEENLEDALTIATGIIALLLATTLSDRPEAVRRIIDHLPHSVRRFPAFNSAVRGN
jgi:hypothetical protein